MVAYDDHHSHFAGCWSFLFAKEGNVHISYTIDEFIFSFYWAINSYFFQLVGFISLRPLLLFCFYNTTGLKDLFCDERMGYFEYAKEMTVIALNYQFTQ